MEKGKKERKKEKLKKKKKLTPTLRNVITNDSWLIKKI